MVWTQALASCQQRGFHLALIENTAMNDAINNMQGKISDSYKMNKFKLLYLQVVAGLHPNLKNVIFARTQI